MKNLLIAKRAGKLLGYLVYDSIEAGHYDIVMVYTHPDHRCMGVASALVKSFAIECINKNGIPYFVCAGSKESSKLAMKLNIRQMRNANMVYKLI